MPCACHSLIAGKLLSHRSWNFSLSHTSTSRKPCMCVAVWKHHNALAQKGWDGHSTHKHTQRQQQAYLSLSGDKSGVVSSAVHCQLDAALLLGCRLNAAAHLPLHDVDKPHQTISSHSCNQLRIAITWIDPDEPWTCIGSH